MNKRKVKKIQVFTGFLNSLKELSTSSTLKVACLSVKIDFSKIASLGYNGSYPNAKINSLTNTEEESLEPGKSGFVHAEINMISKFMEHDSKNYIVLLTHSPCTVCTKVLINAGFKYIYYAETYRETSHLSILDDCNILHGDFKKLYSDYPKILNK